MLRLFWMFFKISAVALGGGYAMVPVMMKNLTNKGYLTNNEFKHILIVAQAMPGPIAFKISFLSGKKIAGIKGSIAATLGVLIPPFFSIILVASILKEYSDNIYVSGFINGAYASLIGMVGGILYDFIKSTKIRIYDILIIIFSVFIMFFYPRFTVIIFFASIILFYFLDKGFGKNA
ncbi:chromate transporter [Marinitoga hydrogenitolerans DSM 16785]|uniref:Chromate transporter n=1 Tax=Marinitoga hydrogenitolerans (strain DSM 16785 / JCM 12826 / AT1271) TaxID=1122195 RepID=A0A1M4V886_MARH1|nr:chromate transporter [Marinitoga hydrogenitolerans]SHE65093.1 chromate transporter [Marinitoga hydrogenitolerans DSM 16785]